MHTDPAIRFAVPPPPPPYEEDLGNDALVTEVIEAARRAAMEMTEEGRSVESMRRRLVEMITESLRTSTPMEWLAYWQGPRFDRYGRMFRAMKTLARTFAESAEAIDQVEEEQQDHCQQLVVDHFPEAEDELCFASHLMNRAHAIVRQLLERRVTDPDLRAKDADCADRYNYGYLWYSIGLNSLLLVSDPEDEPVVIDAYMARGIIEVVRQAALHAHHAALEGRSLRSPDDAEPAAHQADEGDDDLRDEDLSDVEASIEKVEASIQEMNARFTGTR